MALNRLVAPAFISAIFTSAFLLFAVQPMFTKLALPLLGGAPNVWNTAMVFFQGALLLGYLYAHLLNTYLPLRAQIIFHGVVLTGGLLFLPIAAPVNWTPPTESGQNIWLLGFMATAIGAPFFALSANAPLLQRWFSHSNHETAKDPYYLYAASNVGSLLSLLLYPLLIEPRFGLVAQSSLWSWGYTALIILVCIAAAMTIWSTTGAAPVSNSESSHSISAQRIMWRRRVIWLGLAAVPSGLMLSVTTHLTLNVAPSPFLWILPLSLYLLSFIIAFTALGARLRAPFAYAAPLAVIAGVVLSPFVRGDFFISSAVHLVMFFVVAIALHAELVARRPRADQLTEFYLWMSIGGVLGGVFTAIVAPSLFLGVWEYPILLLLAVFAGVGLEARLLRAVGVTLGVGVLWTAGSYFALRGNEGDVDRIFQDRSFFGVLAVERRNSEYGSMHAFYHGNNVHNIQLRNGADETKPLANFGSAGPFAEVIDALRAEKETLSVATVGLGAGALACYAKPGDKWRFFEIDPEVVRIATTPRLFSFLSECAPEADIEIGDARISLEQERRSGHSPYDLLIIDAFSSESIPAHLITTEALELYRARVRKDGLILFNTSNRYMDVSSVAIRSAEAVGLDWRYVDFKPEEETTDSFFNAEMEAVVIGETPAVEKFALARGNWSRRPAHPLIGVAWTDDYSNVLAALRAKRSAK